MTAAPPPKGKATPATVALVTATGLRLREGPSVTSLVLRTLRRGTRVKVIETSRDGVWTRVEQNVTGGEPRGWMASKYLAPEGHPATTAGLADDPWMLAALHELGVREVPGEQASARVVEYLRSTDLDRTMALSDETPWCSAFVNWCMEVCGLVGTNSAAARSWLGWGQGLTLPRRGAVTVLTRDKGGHVGLFVAQTATHVRLLGGNQGNQVCVADYDKSRLLGYRVPS